MSDIFLSYRRQDSLSATGRLADRLEQHFGPKRVFRDYDSIVAGKDFADAINSAISVSTVVLAVVGPDWVEARDGQGHRRLDDPGDFVRIEIETALRTEVPVIPVLVEGAKMPPAEALPESLQAFSRCQAVELTESRWRDDADRLIANLQAQFAIESEQDAVDDKGGEKINVFARFALDMLELATHPRRLIARRQTGHALDHVRAFVFLLACLLLGNVALVSGLGLPGPFSWLLVGELFGIIMITLLSVPLTLAWRLWGARTDFRQVTLIFAYIYGCAWLGFCAGALLIVMGMQMVDAEVFERYLAIFRLPFPFADRIQWAQALLDSTMQGPAMGMSVIAALVWLIAALWGIAAWGAFRLTYNLGRLRAIGATASWIGLLALVIWLASLASQAEGI
jgi:hypothetical protein